MNLSPVLKVAVVLVAVQDVVRLTFRSRFWSLKIPLLLMTQTSFIGESAIASPSGMSGLVLDRRGLRLQARALEVRGFTCNLCSELPPHPHG